MSRSKRADGKNARTVANNKYQRENYDRINIVEKNRKRGKQSMSEKEQAMQKLENGEYLELSRTGTHSDLFCKTAERALRLHGDHQFHPRHQRNDGQRKRTDHHWGDHQSQGHECHGRSDHFFSEMHQSRCGDSWKFRLRPP